MSKEKDKLFHSVFATFFIFRLSRILRKKILTQFPSIGAWKNI
jgi:hypothetical protein